MIKILPDSQSSRRFLAFFFVVAIAAYGLFLQRASLDITQELAANNACNVAEHRVGARLSDRDGLRAVKANGDLLIRIMKSSIKSQREIYAGRPERLKALAKIEKVVHDAEEDINEVTIPPPPAPPLIAQRDRLCKYANVEIEHLPSEGDDGFHPGEVRPSPAPSRT